MNIFKKLVELQSKSVVDFSKYHVSSIIETDKGFYEGVNIEPSVMNLGICAERNALFSSITKGSKIVKNIWLLTDSKENFGTPCGACRQLFVDYVNKDTRIFIYNLNGECVEYKFLDLLPHYWSKKELSNE